MTRAARWWSACLLAALFAGCNPQAPRSAPTPSATPVRAAAPLPLHITGHGTPTRPVRETLQINNRIEYELESKSFESNGAQGKARAVFRDARVTFYDPKGTKLTATAPQAIVDEGTNSVTMIGGVRAKTNTGMTLSCAQLIYDHAAGTLRGSGNVSIAEPNGFRGTGSSFDSDISLSHMRMQ
ncbi:MAG TPA: LPS export ABC transporter periplasmic protein LptC [Candidatus Tumulicola sp.]